MKTTNNDWQDFEEEIVVMNEWINLDDQIEYKQPSELFSQTLLNITLWTSMGVI